jgi:hypothetical protein
VPNLNFFSIHSKNFKIQKKRPFARFIVLLKSQQNIFHIKKNYRVILLYLPMRQLRPNQTPNENKKKSHRKYGL